MEAKFLVGSELVTARVADGASVYDTDQLTFTDGDSEWVATAEQLRESYTPVSHSAQVQYDEIIGGM